MRGYGLLLNISPEGRLAVGSFNFHERVFGESFELENALVAMYIYLKEPVDDHGNEHF